jgi:hypothetical protein
MTLHFVAGEFFWIDVAKGISVQAVLGSSGEFSRRHFLQSHTISLRIGLEENTIPETILKAFSAYSFIAF